MNLEFLLVVLAFALAALFNVILPWVRKKHLEAGQASNAESERQEAPTVLAPVPAALSGREPEARRNAPIRATLPKPAAMAPAVARPARRSPVGSLADVRDGIVLTTILGRCRAQKPFV